MVTSFGMQLLWSAPSFFIRDTKLLIKEYYCREPQLFSL
jgi:hypothetical protein